ncbi:MAG: Stp1/IreP family PP2C-type Ser/Thr phosphatase [Desulfobacula sp.]|nr:Stp1/IreP family PP2C-type Ser/Thr phosphatase [Desulfobacula sp.]
MIQNKIDVWGESHTGHRRKQNEDRYLIKKSSECITLAVADGVGGSPGGDMAAQTAIDVFQEYSFSKEALEKDLDTVLKIAEKQIHRKIDDNPDLDNMGTTLTAAVLYMNKVFWIHIGDSRMYLLHKKKIRKITTDHTFIQDLIDDGTLTLDQAKKHPLKNMLDQCLGCDKVQPDTGIFEVEKNDRLLLCSDGLTAHLSDLQIESILKTNSAKTACQNLISLALKMGGTDNVTVIVKTF